MKGLNDLNNIDGFIKESLKDFKDAPSNDLWDKLSNNLDKIQTGQPINTNPATNPVNSISSKIISTISKSWFYYAAAASVVTLGIVAAVTYFTLNSDEKTIDKQEAINKPDEKFIEKDIIKENIKNNEKIYTPQINNENNKDNSLDNNIIIDNQVQYSDNDKKEKNDDQNINKNDNENKSELNNQNIIADKDKNNIIPKKEEDKKKDLPVAEKKNEYKVQETPEEEIVEESADNQLSMNSEYQTEFGDEFRLEIPNAFTPNGDGINDKFYIGKLSSVENPSLLVYDSRGKVVYKSSKYQNDWDGYNAPDGTYYFYLQYTYKNKVQVKGGSIYISR